MPPTPREQEDFLKAYDSYADAIYRYCYFRVRNNKPVAEDLVQETFTKVWQYLCDGHPIQHLRAFLYQTARNMIIDRQKRKETSNVSLESMREDGFEPKGDSAETIVTEIECHQLLEMMDRLNESDKDLLLLRYVEGYGPKEIANILNETPNAISVRIHRAKKFLKEQYVSP